MTFYCSFIHSYLCVCVFVCVCERERELINNNVKSHQFKLWTDSQRHLAELIKIFQQLSEVFLDQSFHLVLGHHLGLQHLLLLLLLDCLETKNGRQLKTGLET